jgi:chorismate mutase/prephenate dehydrogenase
LALLSVPIAVTPDVARRLGPHLPATCVLADITSVKAKPLAAMLEAHPGPVLGLHPMFGPTTTSMDRQIVVATSGRDEVACQWILDQLAAWGAVVVRAGAEEHDEAMAVVQALRHFATFAFGQFLCRANVDLGRTLEFSGPIYRLELGMVGRLFAQAPELYAEIIFATPERRALLKDYVRSLAGNLQLLEEGDKEAFCREFAEVARWFGPFSDQAIRESTYLIEKLVERF